MNYTLRILTKELNSLNQERLRIINSLINAKLTMELKDAVNQIDSNIGEVSNSIEVIENIYENSLYY